MTETASQGAPDAPLSSRRLLLQMIGGIVVMAGALGVITFLFRDEFAQISEGFVAIFGGAGVWLTFFLTDAFPIPVPPDPAMAFALMGNIAPWEVIVWGVTGSLTGGTLGYLLGRRLSHTRFFQRLIAGKSETAYRVVDKYGVLGVALCALTPLPYVVASWTAGALGMPFRRFFAVSLIRIVRVSLYVALLQWGLDQLFR
ncbi:MAG: VTT domain-containing protein [Candidatus Lernaella stagnicola]|nr:VTT domain-containing protein [Candidatus Lernaella stagnicola]